MKNPNKRVNIGALEAKTLYLGGGRGLLTYTWIITKIKYIIQCYILSNDDMIYTFVNIYIVFVTPVMDDMMTWMTYREYGTAGHLVFWKPWPAVKLKKVLSVTKHTFVF